jgi:hypothetical protein
MRNLVAMLIVCLVGASHAQERVMSPEEGAKFQARLRLLARTYYPALTSAKELPNGIVLGFLVDRSGAVLAHTAGMRGPTGVSVPAELARMFPGRGEDQFLRMHGNASGRTRVLRVLCDRGEGLVTGLSFENG